MRIPCNTYYLLSRWTLDESLIGSNPGVGMKPPMSDLNIASSMYVFDTTDTSTTTTDKDGEGEKNADLVKRLVDR